MTGFGAGRPSVEFGSPDPMSQFHLKRVSLTQEFPDPVEPTWMGLNSLTPAMYRDSSTAAPTVAPPISMRSGPRPEEPALAAAGGRGATGRLPLAGGQTRSMRELNLSSPTSSQLRRCGLRTGLDASYLDEERWQPCDLGQLDDHLRLVSTQDDANIAGVLLNASASTLQKLEEYYRAPTPIHLEAAGMESSALYVVSNAATIGLSEVELTQLVVDGSSCSSPWRRGLEAADRDITSLFPHRSRSG
ncbi:creatine kinase M-type-like isoform X1 [Lates japonicus]|uniref:Creatine kinase M-type-like isoform X1 n=1 Tax=Lates japonicus TaxID=270547 RepID=A0AAD3MT14_LATJO|nr:creatine kinase M-type-like isoform X1 [Lates japonicus]